MTLTEAYESLLKVHAKKDSITGPDESLVKEEDKDCCMMPERSEHQVFQTFLSERLMFV